MTKDSSLIWIINWSSTLMASPRVVWRLVSKELPDWRLTPKRTPQSCGTLLPIFASTNMKKVFVCICCILCFFPLICLYLLYFVCILFVFCLYSFVFFCIRLYLNVVLSCNSVILRCQPPNNTSQFKDSESEGSECKEIRWPETYPYRWKGTGMLNFVYFAFKLFALFKCLCLIVWFFPVACWDGYG